MPANTGYTRRQIALHWATVLAVAAQYILHEGIADAFDTGLDTGAFAISTGVATHIALGLIIFGVTGWRLLLRRNHLAPPPPEGEPPVFQRLSKLAHFALYALLLLLPVTGAIAWGGQSEAFGNVHEVLRAALLLLILAHVGAVIVHQVVWKTGLMARMITQQD